jgi:hypothetical protein
MLTETLLEYHNGQFMQSSINLLISQNTKNESWDQGSVTFIVLKHIELNITIDMVIFFKSSCPP